MVYPRLPKYNSVIQFHSITPTRYFEEYVIDASVEESGNGFYMKGGKVTYRTSCRKTISEIDRLCRELGSLFEVVVKVDDKGNMMIVSNPNLRMPLEV